MTTRADLSLPLPQPRRRIPSSSATKRPPDWLTMGQSQPNQSSAAGAALDGRVNESTVTLRR